MTSSKHFQILFAVCVISNISNLIAGNTLDSVVKHKGPLTYANHQETNEELEILKDELQEVLEGQGRIQQELEILLTNNLHLKADPPVPSINDVLRNVQSSKSTVGVYYQGDPKNKADATPPQDCKEAYQTHKVSGIYKIKPLNFPDPIVVFCDMTTSAGGWTVIQNRVNGSQDFFLEWRDYKFGFGDLGGEFWIGLETIHALTDSNAELLVQLVALNGETPEAHYDGFEIGPETDGYPLRGLGDFSGSAGDSLTYHKGQKFSTKDYDQDGSSTENCAEKYFGAWWYDACLQSNLNGKFINIITPPGHKEAGLYWKTYGTGAMAQSRLLVRRKDF